MGEQWWEIPPFRVDSEALTLAGDERIDWGVEQNAIPNEWARTQGEGILVAILDTGGAEHVDLPEPAFVHNFTNSRTAMDRHGHSTHCAGIVGARANDTGVIGVAPKCRIGYCKVLGDSGGGSTDWIAKGIRKAVEEGAHVISMSIGGGYAQSVDYACREAAEAGVMLVAAAGNSGYRDGQNTMDWPGRLDTVTAVGSYRRDGQISTFSSGGPEIDVAAPGEQILSCYLGNQYRLMSGTSMATPFIAALDALALATGKGPKSIGEKHALYRQVCLDRGAPGRDARFGFGVVIPSKFIQDPEPDAPDDQFLFCG